MTTAGYSGTPLVAKLGIKPGQVLCFINPPRGYFSHLGKLPAKCTKVRALRDGLSFVQFFSRTEAEVAVRFPEIKAALLDTGFVWVCWPKKASGVETDLSDGVVRRLGLASGLVDSKVCAVDETWSGLKFCYRLKDRGKRRTV